MYVVNPEIMKSWNIDDDVQMAVLSKSMIFNDPTLEE